MMKHYISPWIITSVCCLTVGLVLDLVAVGLESWGSSEEERYFNSGGLWNFCNGTRHWDPRAKEEIAKDDPECKEFRLVNHAWIPLLMTFEVLGVVSGVGIFLGLVAFFVSLKWDWTRNRSVVVALIPLSFLAGAFNFVGAIVFGINWATIYKVPGHAWAIDAASVPFFFVGAGMLICDMQGVCLKKRPKIGKGLARPI